MAEASDSGAAPSSLDELIQDIIEDPGYADGSRQADADLTADEAMLVLVLGLLVLMAERGRESATGIAAGLLFHATKLFSAWSIFPFLLTKRRDGWIGFAVALLGVVGVMVVVGASPISFEFSRDWQGDDAVGADDLVRRVTDGNAWFLLSRPVIGLRNSPVPNLVALGALAVAAWVLWRAARSRIEPGLLIVSGTGLFTLTYLVFAPMTPPYFLVTAVLALVIMLPKRESFRKYLPWMIAWTALVFINYNVGALHFRMAAASVSIPAWISVPYYALQVPQIALTAVMAWVALRFIREECGSDSCPR